MNAKWIVAVDREKARFFLEEPFEQFKLFENPLGRAKNKELTTDRPGFSRGKFGRASSIYSMSGEKNPHEDAAIHFAKEIGRFLSQQDHAKNFESISIASEPKMMGRLRSELSEKLNDRVNWVSKDLTHLKNHEIAEVFGINLRLAL
jgi:protein required for attachment to host cells